MKGFIRILIVLSISFTDTVWSGEEIRDYYAEPGLNPFKSYAGQDDMENIDPFSGNIQLSYTDLVIPGPGGLDIKITRFYNVPQGFPTYGNPYGYGWTMHFGRITVPDNPFGNVEDDTTDNASIEMPDGGRHLLVRSSVPGVDGYITASNWRAEFIDPLDLSLGFKATAPNGTIYYMRERMYIQGEDGTLEDPAPFVLTWLTDKIVDLDGNTIDFIFETHVSGMKLISRIEASDGRLVTFSYDDRRLAEINANGQKWTYNHEPISEIEVGWGTAKNYRLMEVMRPDGSSWKYSYGSGYTGLLSFNNDRLVEITYPSGGRINYTYQKIKPYAPDDQFEVIAIGSKIQANSGEANGTWTYNFEPGGVYFSDIGNTQPENVGRRADVTRINTPEGEEHLYHVGYWAMPGRSDVLWEMGLKLRHDVLAVNADNVTLTLVKSQLFSWGARSISYEDYRRGIITALRDYEVYAPVLISEYTYIEGYSTRTDYVSHDEFGNILRMTEYSNLGNTSNRITLSGYENRIADWLIGLETSRRIYDGDPEGIPAPGSDGPLIGSINRTFNAEGRLATEEKFGVLTTYNYNFDGDISAIVDARNNAVQYSNYSRGVPRQESYPDGTQIIRTINSTGTVASETSARGYTTSFSYDGLNRLTGIDYPLGADVTISWADTQKTLRRGAYEEVVKWDGYGRDISVQRSDLLAGATFKKTFNYDEFGRKIFESDPNSLGGTEWEYDLLGRIVKIINRDNTSKSISYQGFWRELHTNENGNTTDFRYLVYGKPENKYLHDILSPAGVATLMDLDGLGNITSVFQGGPNPDVPGAYLGYTKTFDYNSKFQLISVNSPADIGLTTYGRDALGNMISKQVDVSNPVLYSYDPMNRLKTVDYVDDLIDVAYSYDPDGNIVSIANSYGSRAYNYNEIGNLIEENIAIGGSSYRVQYVHDALDNVQQVIYPSGRIVNYAPDALGRPTRALPYLTRVDYFADGNLRQIDFANGQTSTYTRTARKWIDTITVGGVTPLVQLDYNYDGGGNILSILDGVDPSKNRTMTYDGLNRLKTVIGSWGQSSMEYDAFNNITSKTDPSQNNRSQDYTYSGMQLYKVSVFANQERYFSYDSFGNSTGGAVIAVDSAGDPVAYLGNSVQVYDDAGNMVSSRRDTEDANGIAIPLKSGYFSSQYDGKNNRIKKIDHYNNEKETQYVYSEAGLLLGEYDSAGSLYGQEHFYLGTAQIATAKTNVLPTVNAGFDVATAGGLRVDLEGADSDIDGKIVSRLWAQVSGPAVTIETPTNQTTSFLAPEGSTDEVVVLSYIVTDDKGESSSDELVVNVSANHPPVADAGPDISALAGTTVQLDGSGSFDLEGPISYEWSGGALSDPTIPNPTTYITDQGINVTYNFILTVTDSDGVTASDSVMVRFFTDKIDTDKDGLTDGWETLNFGDLTSNTGLDDPDGDGVTNRQEYLESTSPSIADATSTVTRWAVVPGDRTNVLSWDKSLSAQGYRIYWSTDAAAPLASWVMVEASGNYY